MQRLVALTLFTFSTAPGHAAERILLADNSQVAAAWAQEAPAAPVPDVVAQPEGGTRIEWHGGISLDAYQNHATGGTTLNPTLDGGFFRLQAQGDLRASRPDGSLNWLQFNLARSDDRAVQSVNTLIGTLNGGFSGPDYQVTLGDVTPDFSSLGTRLGLRGVMAQKLLGQTVLSGTVGTLTPIWNDLWEEDTRAQYLRHVAAFKLDTPLGTGTRGFITLQGYGDDSASLDGNLAGAANGFAAATNGRTATLGIVHQDGPLALVTELGLSRWESDGQADENDHAFIADGTYSGQGYTLRAGHHDLGRYYTSLSAQVAPGIRETYLGGNWQTTTWLALQGDLRRSRNEQAQVAGSVAAVSTDAVALAEVITFGADWPGLSLTLNQNVSQGDTQAGSDITHQGHGATLGYATPSWNGSLGINQRWVRNDADTANNSRTDGVTLQLGRQFSDDPANPTWSVALQGSVGYQFQKLDAGGDNQNILFGLGVAASRLGWGTLNASYTVGRIDPTTGADLRNRGYLLEASHPFKSGAVKLYARENRNFSGNAVLANTARTVGAQLTFQF